MGATSGALLLFSYVITRTTLYIYEKERESVTILVNEIDQSLFIALFWRQEEEEEEEVRERRERRVRIFWLPRCPKREKKEFKREN